MITELTIREQELKDATEYSPNKFPQDNLVWWRTWDYFDQMVPKSNWEEFND